MARARPLLKNRQVEMKMPDIAKDKAAISAASGATPSARAHRRAPTKARTRASTKRRPNATGSGRSTAATVSGKNRPKFGLPARGCPKEAPGCTKGMRPARSSEAIHARAGRWVRVASW